MFGEGLYLVAAGLFKKVVIADNMAVIVDAIFSARTDALSGFEVLLGVYAFAFQIYGDFSGYSSIARGVSRWMGFDLMVNFRIPYLAISPSDFWGRWHISLSTWLRDYLYIPLGGNRGGNVATYRNLMITMLLGGLWHGAAWTFVFWGFYHGLLLCVFRGLGDKTKTKPPGIFQRVLRVLMMFNLVCLGWLFFRADSMGQAFAMLHQIVNGFYWTPFGWGLLGVITFYVVPMIVYELWLEKKGLLALVKKNWALQTAFYGYCFFGILFFPSPAKQVFIYFQF
jgi:D-alanyl-lipoteichoic acid acyltransferase DltB (MBOAT superfamily)